MALRTGKGRPNPDSDAMTDLLVEHTIACPYCGASFIALVDSSEGEAIYIQDCEVCCHPIRFELAIDGSGETGVSVYREEDD